MPPPSRLGCERSSQSCPLRPEPQAKAWSPCRAGGCAVPSFGCSRRGRARLTGGWQGRARRPRQAVIQPLTLWMRWHPCVSFQHRPRFRRRLFPPPLPVKPAQRQMSRPVGLLLTESQPLPDQLHRGRRMLKFAVPEKGNDLAGKGCLLVSIQFRFCQRLLPVGERNRAIIHKSWPDVKCVAFAADRATAEKPKTGVRP